MKTSLDNFSRKTIATKVISLTITLNNFVFNWKSYIQIKGCDMGIICAPFYANMFMDHLKIYIYLCFTRVFMNQFKVHK